MTPESQRWRGNFIQACTNMRLAWQNYVLDGLVIMTEPPPRPGTTMIRMIGGLGNDPDFELWHDNDNQRKSP